MRVLVIEDESLTREVLAKVCTDLGHAIVASVDTGPDAVNAAIRHKPDVLLLDLMLPQMDGFEVAAQVRKRGINAKILAISTRCDPYTIFQIERARFDGFMDKQVTMLDDLREALHSISAGKSYFSRSFRNGQLSRGQDKGSFDKVLTNQQSRILSMIGDLQTDAEIAAALEISHDTLLRHRREILHKLGLKTNDELPRYAREQGFVSYAVDKEPKHPTDYSLMRSALTPRAGCSPAGIRSPAW